MGILDSAKSMAEKMKDKAPDILDKVEDQVEKLEGKGGAVGKVATGSHKVIDSIQEKLPTKADPATPATPPAPAATTEPPDTVAGADPEGPTEFGTTAE